MSILSTKTREAILQTRLESVKQQEFAEAAATNWSAEHLDELTDIHDRQTETRRELLTICIGFELLPIVTEHKLDTAKKSSAMPEYAEAITESIDEYVAGLVEDALFAYNLPALEIVDEINEWLHDLNEYYKGA